MPNPPNAPGLLDSLDLLETPDGADSNTVPLTYAGTNRRGAQRYLVSWRAHVFADKETPYPGLTLDLSASGASLLLEHNLRPKGLSCLHFAIPPAAGLPAGQTAEVIAEHVYSILDAKHKHWRVAFKFLEFNSGRDLMMKRLALSPPVPGPVRGHDALLSAGIPRPKAF